MSNRGSRPQEAFGERKASTGGFRARQAHLLICVSDFVVLPSAFLAMGVRFGDVGMIAFVPAASMYLAAMVAGRAAYRARLAWQVDRAIDLEAWRTSPTKSTQH